MLQYPHQCGSLLLVAPDGKLPTQTHTNQDYHYRQLQITKQKLVTHS